MPTITHAKVSGLPNPSDPALVGGEDWNDPHEIAGPAVVDTVRLWLTTGGAISSESFGLLNFAKTATGTYRANFDSADFGSADPIVVPAVTTPSGAPVFVRWSIGNDGTNDYVELVTINASGTAVDVASGSIALVAGAIL